METEAFLINTNIYYVMFYTTVECLTHADLSSSENQGLNNWRIEKVKIEFDST